MARPATIDKFREVLFSDTSDIPALSTAEEKQLQRYRAIFAKRLDDPSITNRAMVEYLIVEYGVSQSQAYRELSETERIFGSVANANKEWTRYLVTEKLKEALTRAEEKGKVKEMINAATALGKFARLDKEDATPMPYEEIVPAPIEYSTDPHILGIEIDNPAAFVAKIKKQHIDDVDYEEV